MGSGTMRTHTASRCLIAAVTEDAEDYPEWFLSGRKRSRKAVYERRAGTDMLRPGKDADGTGHAGSAEPAIPVRILGQILLMVLLGVIELRRLDDLGRDRSVPGGCQLRLVRVARRLGRAPLIVVVAVDPRSILRADVVALPHALRRIVAFPKRFQQILVSNLL